MRDSRGNVIILVAVYRPPECLFQLYANFDSFRDSRIILHSDFNVPEVDWSVLKGASRTVNSQSLHMASPESSLSLHKIVAQVPQFCT